MNAENAATAICAMAQLPEFQVTPSITKSLQDLHLASKARLLLAMDKRTSHMNVKIRANDRIAYITYLPQQVKDAGKITDVLEQLRDIKEIICTEAETNILWIQEKFDRDDSSYRDVDMLAKTLDAAVELIEITPSDTLEQLTSIDQETERRTESWRETGIMDDKAEEDSKDSSGISKIYERLIKDGHAGGKRIIKGSQKTLLNAIDRSTRYRLIILDNIFMSKGHEARIRQIREWSNFISDNLKIPVLTLDEIHTKYRFGIRDIIRMMIFAIITAILILLIFQFDEKILSFLSRDSIGWKILAAVAVFIFVPFFAYIYSTVTRLFLKMIKFE
jgi:hypothetical protein